MKKSLFTLFSLLLVLMAAPMVTAQTEIKLATINMERLFEGYHKSAEFRNRMGSVRNEAQAELQSRRDALQQKIASFEEKRENLENPMLSAERKRELEQELQQELEGLRAQEQELMRWQQSRMNQINQSEQQLRADLIKEIREVVISTASADAVTLVMDTSDVLNVGVPTVLYVDTQYDITDKVLRQLNRNAPGL